MDTKMKGLLKGLRYISQIFEGEDKEPEMQIGFPTDVKHVAHIGWDGPSTTAPSWMNEYRSAPLSASVGGETAPTADQFKPTGAGADSTSGGGPPRPRTSRRKDSSTSSNPDSPGRGDSTKPSRRRPSTGAVSVDSLPRESTTEGSRRGRRNHSSSEGSGSAGGLDSQPSQHDHPAGVPKQSRRRKTKESSSSGGSSRSRNRASDSTHGSAPAELMPLPSMPEREEYHGGF